MSIYTLALESSCDETSAAGNYTAVGVGSGYSLQPGTDHSEMYTEEF